MMNKEERIKITVNEEDVQNIIDCYEKDIEHIKELEQRIKTYEDPEDLTLMFMYCDEKAKYKIKDLQQRIDKAIDDIDKLEKDIMNNTIIGFNQFIPVFNKIKNDLKGSEQ